MRARMAVDEAARRQAERIPPGFAERDKGDATGDYILWRQLLNEAKDHQRPILFVTDDSKEDWVRLGRGKENLGPRPELVLEMQEEAGVRLHVSSVRGLLADARRYLGSDVSSSTLEEAEAPPPPLFVEQNFTQEVVAALERMSDTYRANFLKSASSLAETITSSGSISEHPDVLVHGTPKDRWYSLRWDTDGRATFRLEDRGDGNLTIYWLHVRRLKEGLTSGAARRRTAHT
jgi:hypothetical protein